MNTLFESQLDLFSTKNKYEVIDWIEENDLTGMGMDVKKVYRVKLSDNISEDYIKIGIQQELASSHGVTKSFVLHIRIGGIPLVKRAYDYDVDLKVIEHDIAWNEWIDLPPLLVDDMLQTIDENIKKFEKDA